MVYDKGKENIRDDVLPRVGWFMAQYGDIIVQPVEIQE